MTSTSDQLLALDAELHLLKLRFETSKAHDAICDTATARFRYHLCRLLTEEGIPLRQASLVNRALGRFRAAVVGASRAEAVERRYRICQAYFSKRKRGAALVTALGEAPAALETALRRLFREHAEDLAHRSLLRSLATLALKRAGDAFSADVADRIARHHAALDKSFLEYFAFKFGEELGPGNRGDDEGQPGIMVCDAFGRGLLQSVDTTFGIKGYDQADKVDVFLREYCAPVLGILKHLVFGIEKYGRINERFMAGIDSACKNGGEHCRALLKEFYAEEKVARYLAGFELYVLKVMHSEVRRNHFLHSVNLLVAKSHPDIPAFSQRALDMLFRAWVMHVQAHLHLLHVQRGTRRILAYYADRLI